jgi:adenosylcobinamide kinase / adenosylcobinamide-phosphate guanylyltransferase
MEARSVLVIGGARSGKSAFARKLAEESAAERLYVATGSAADDEMAARIALHRAERGDVWKTREERLALVAALEGEARPGRIVLVDCLTFWLSNCMFAGLDLAYETALLCTALGALRGPVVLVSNEVGSGIVPDSRLGRDFRDWQGRLNQEAARACDAVVMIAAGLPTLLKPASQVQVRLR